MVDIDIPICQGTYSTGSTKDVREMCFLKAVHQTTADEMHKFHPFFLGVCYHCWTPRYIPGYECDLLRCGGCQLVAFCSKVCQKENWSKHKFVCKKFPVVKGKNVLNTKESWKKHIANLRKVAGQIPHSKPIFHNPRVCRICKEASQEHLTDCVCMCVSYCSKRCSKADKQHQNSCKDLLQLTQHYSIQRFKSILPALRYNTDCNTFTPVSSWKDVMSHQYTLALQYHSHTEKKNQVQMEDSFTKERHSYPMSLLYALQSLPGRYLRCSGPPLEELTTLAIHVVTSIPYYDSDPWEVLMHRLPKLEQLNIVYVHQGKSFRHSFGLIRSSFKRCNDCENKNRVINYSVHQMPYHMFFSSPKYTDPDVVVVYGNEYEMSSSNEDCIQREISYRNMTHNRDTVLVLMDATKDQLNQGVNAVNTAQRVDQLVPSQSNPLRGFSSNRAEVDSDSDIINDKYYFSCLRRK